jgi:hypothetical protein
MRMTVKGKEDIPEVGTIREKTAFLWLPMRISLIWRWLERATWKEEVKIVETDYHYYSTYDPTWVAIGWLD